MKTSGVSCEPNFGLLGFLGHPILPIKKNLNMVPNGLKINELRN